MNDARAIVVCVDYHDILSLTLPYNRPQFKSVTVVTHPKDEKTIQVATDAGAEVFLTTVFYEWGALFNKFAAIECGLDYMGRHGQLCILDADIVIPRRRPAWQPVFGKLHTPRRRMFPSIPQSIPEERLWGRHKPKFSNESFAGYFQMFHAEDPVLSGKTDWHSRDWKWAGTGDTFFSNLWSERDKVRPPFEVLHIGDSARNWAGRVSQFADGTVPEEASAREGNFIALRNARRGRRGDARYMEERLE